ncbi:MAG TPA: ribonuclease HI family protein [Thermomicrobiaceae bacterium]|nr:ribonuclease HI family protein [Thermomicrobiaceae bacterium]
MADLTIVFDGGSKGNPGFGYGSFQLGDRAGFSEITRLEYGDRVTNNQAEYRTLIAALQQALGHAARRGWPAGELSLAVRSDSQLVIEQVLGRWKIRHPGLQPLAAEARRLIAQFGQVTLTWQPRAQTVKVLGH